MSSNFYMRLGRASVWAAIVASGAIMGGTAWAQNPTPATPQNPISTAPEGTPPACGFSATRTDGKVTGSSTCNPPASGSTSQRFPYPGDSTAPPATSTPAADAPQQNGTQQNGTQQGTPGGSTAQRFPFPGEDSKGSSSGSANSPLKDAGSSGSSSDSSSSSSSSNAGDLGGDAPDANKPDDLPAPKRSRKKISAAAPVQPPDEREAEDVKIAAFYQNDGNFQGAYLRAKDAVTIMDADPEAHFALAEAARKLGKLDEAEKNYKRCLELDPLPKQKKDSQKALKDMSGS